MSKNNAPQPPSAKTRRSARPDMEIENILSLYRLDEINFFGYRLGTAAKLYDRCIARIIDSHGINLSQWRVMAQLSVRPGGTIRALAEGAAADRAEASRTVRDMIDKALVDRQENPKDARSPTFSLTLDGRAFYEEIRPSIEALIEELMQEVSGEQLKAAADLLRKMTIRAVRRLGQEG